MGFVEYIRSKQLLMVMLVMCWCGMLFGCASSDIARDTASNVDLGVKNARSLYDGATETNLADSYQNATQATKGALIGGTAGAITGAFSTSIGFFPGLLVGTILGGSYGSYIETYTTLRDRLENRGVNIVILGDQILIVIPSARLFASMSSNLKPQAYTTLNMVTQFINQYTKMLVNIAAYTGGTDQCMDIALAQQQANAVAKFLLACGVDARLLYAIGRGSTNLVSKDVLDWDGSGGDNYRIEITLEKLYV